MNIPIQEDSYATVVQRECLFAQIVGKLLTVMMRTTLLVHFVVIVKETINFIF